MCLSGDIIVTESVDGHPVFLSLVLLSHRFLTWPNFLIAIFIVGFSFYVAAPNSFENDSFFPVLP